MATGPTAADIRQTVLDIAQDVASHRQLSAEEARADEACEVVDAETQINLVPLPRSPSRPFRTELTIERNSVFVANTFGERFFVRETEHQVDGEVEKVRVLVGKLDERDKDAFGVLTQTHQDAFYELLKLWGDAGHPTVYTEHGTLGVLRVSGWQLVTSLRAGDDAAKAYRKVRKLLHEMKSTPIVIRRSRPGRRAVTKRLYLLSGLEWDEEGVDTRTGAPGAGGRSDVTVLFSPHITDSFRKTNIKVLLAGPYAALGKRGKGRRGEIARLLYPWLDYQLAGKNTYRAKLSTLIERFGLQPTPYKSKRKEKFARALAALDGQLIHQERHKLSIALEESADGSDYILVARKVRGPRG